VTCGNWVNSDSGWDYDCPSFAWGWLPFHYGNWGWFGGHWGWVPGHQWSPAAVEWRHGGGLIGWRPIAPPLGGGRSWGGTPHVGVYDSQWRFTSQSDFGRPNVGAHLFNNPAEGLRVTQPVAHLPVNGATRPIQAASLARARYNTSVRVNTAARARMAAVRSMPAERAPAYHTPSNTYRGPSNGYRAPATSYRAPAYHSAPVYREPARQTYDRETPPSRSSSESSHSSSESSHSSSGGSSHSSGGGHSGGGGHGGRR
jgi:uncharacterized membrane protein YgcG